jgi:disulfide bond formation protein DsbB
MQQFSRYALFSAMFCTLLLISAYFIAFHFRIEPCPLCLLQRYALIGITVLSVSACIHRPQTTGKLFYIFCQLGFCLIGILLTLRHLWLQYLAPHDIVLSCTAGLDRMLQFQPLFATLKEVVFSSESCAEIDFTIFNLPLSAWSFFFFIAMSIFDGWLLKLIIKRRI